VSETQYALNSADTLPKKDSSERLHRKWLFEHLEGLSEDELAALDLERGTRVQQSHIEVLGWGSNVIDVKSKEVELKKEKAMEDKIKMAYKDGAMGRKVGFILPSAATGESTTRLSVKIRQGTVYHAVVRYRSLDEVRDELFEFDWDQLEGLKLNDGNDPACMHAKYKCEMLLRVSGRFELESKNKCKACQQGLLLGVCTCRQKDIDVVSHSKKIHKPQSPHDVEICDRLREKMEAGFEVFSGRGRSLREDRLFVRNALWKVMQDPALACILRECIVYVPATVLDSVELIDAPGTGTESPQERLQLEKALRTANNVVVMMQRNLQDATDIRPVLEDFLGYSNYEMLKRLVELDEQCPIFLFSALDEKGSFSNLEDQDELTDLEERKESIRDKNLTAMSDLLTSIFSSMPDDGKSESMKDMSEEQFFEKCKPKLKKRIFSGCPLLWASLSLSSGEDDSCDVKKEREDALCGVSRMLSAIKGNTRETRLATLMRTFSEAVKSVVPASQAQMKDDAMKGGLTKEMSDRAKQEAVHQSAKRILDPAAMDDMKRRFDMKVCIPLKERSKTEFEDKFLLKAIERMTPPTFDVKNVIADVHKQMTGARRWQALQTAFSKDLAGTYKTLNLFKSFFNSFAPPSDSELKTAIEKLGVEAMRLLQDFMQEEIIDTLKSTKTRSAQSEEVSAVVESMVKKSVQEHVPIQGSHDSQMLLGEALSFFSRGLAKTKRKSVKALMHESQVESLKENLLTEHGIQGNTSKDRRKKDGKDLEQAYKQRVEDKAEEVIDGAKNMFEKSVKESVVEMLKEFKRRMIERRGKTKRLPLLFKFRRSCFQRLIDLDAVGDDSDDDQVADIRPLLEEFESKWQKLLSEMGKEDAHSEEDAHRRFRESIYVQHMAACLGASIDDRFPSTCAARKMKVAPTLGEPQAIACEQASTIVADMKAGIKCVDEASYGELRNRLARWKLELGYSKRDANSLFRTLDQILRDNRAREDEDGEGSSDTTDENSEKHVRLLRRAIVKMVLRQHQTQDERDRFERFYKESVQDWTQRMTGEEEPGDVVCIEYFARLFCVNIRVHTPLCEAALQFNKFLDEASFYRIAHVPFEPDQDVNASCFVPIWKPPFVSFTPLSTPVHTYEETKRRLSGERQRRKDSAEARMASAGTPDDIEKTRDRQRFNKYWRKAWSQRHQREYFVHVASKTSVFPEDFTKVVNHRHPRIKIPEKYRDKC